MAKGPFVSLHNHTQLGSPQDGMNDVNELFEQAKRLDHRAIAITDHGTLNAHYDSWKASKETGVKLIPGAEFYFCDDTESKRNYHLVLLPKNENGYRQILRLNYEAYRNPSPPGYMGKKYPRITWEHLEKFNQDVFALTACSNGIIGKTLIADDDEEKAICHMKRFHSIFKDRFFLEIQPHVLKTEDGKVDQVRLNNTLVQYAAEYGMNYVATCDAHYLDKDQAKYHDFMLAIKDSKPVDDPDRFRYGTQEMYLKSHEEIIDFFGADIAKVAMENSIRIADACTEADYLEPRGPMLPKFPVEDEPDYNQFRDWHKEACPDIEEDKAYLRYKCVEGFKKKVVNLGTDDKKLYWDRVKKELQVLEARDFSSYILIVADYINWAKRNKIAVGPARGSGAGSEVLELTGITQVDPIKYDLLFERFHNNKKESFPDIDTDFSDPGRVKEYLKEKYGEDHVASISNWSLATPKVIIKDVARSLRLGGDKATAFKIANHITDIMPDTKTVEEAVEKSSEFARYMKKYPELYENARKLQNLTRNWSTHAAGVVISNRPLYEVAPLRIDDTGLVITQWEKERCEANGLIKMDILGVKTLKVIADALRIINTRHDMDLVAEDIPLDDPETFDMIGRGETAGVFQLEASLAPLCLRIKPKTVEEVSNINALGRPSCSPEQRSSYINRLDGREKVAYRHPNLEGALKKTYGISLYEEGMMTIAKDCAGWDLNEADALRKITKLKGKKPELVESTKSKFIDDCVRHSGMTPREASDIWVNEIEPFGKYGFNKSHSVSYSHISVWTAWLRCHYPTEFMCALINTEDPNSDAVQEYLSECKSMGIEVLPPDINDSDEGYKVVEDKKLLTGLSAIKGVGAKALEDLSINQPFQSLADFFFKTNSRVVQKTVIQSLTKSGAMDTFGRTRKDVFENYTKYRTKVNNLAKKVEKQILVELYPDEYEKYNAIPKKEKQIREKALAAMKDRDDFIGIFAYKMESAIYEIDFGEYYEEWDRKELLLGEQETLGRTISGSMHEVFAGFFSRNSTIVTPLKRVESLNTDTRIKVEAIIKSKIKEIKIKNGQNAGKKMAKYRIEDVHGDTAEVTLFSKHYESYRSILTDGIPIKAICRVDEYMGKKGLSLSALESVFGKRL